VPLRQEEGGPQPMKLRCGRGSNFNHAWSTGALRLPGRVFTDRVPEWPAHGTGTIPRTYLYAMAALPGPANGTTSVRVNPALVHQVSN